MGPGLLAIPPVYESIRPLAIPVRPDLTHANRQTPCDNHDPAITETGPSGTGGACFQRTATGSGHVMRQTLLCLALLLPGGCGFVQLAGPSDSGPEQDQNQEQAQEQAQDKTESDARDCRWQTTRGVAQLKERLNGEALFEFFPGELPVKAPSRPDWHEGDEFKAILRHADQEGCGVTIDIMESLEST